jgi:hypothetical protein
MTNLPDFETCYNEAARLQLEKLTDAAMKASQKKDIQELVRDRFPYYLKTNEPAIFGLTTTEFNHIVQAVDSLPEVRKYNNDFTFLKMSLLILGCLALGFIPVCFLLLWFTPIWRQIDISTVFSFGFLSTVLAIQTFLIASALWKIISIAMKHKNHVYLKKDIQTFLYNKHFA